MKQITYKLICILTGILSLAATVAAITVTGRGFLDLSNIARIVLIVLAVILINVSVMTGRKGFKS